MLPHAIYIRVILPHAIYIRVILLHAIYIRIILICELKGHKYLALKVCLATTVSNSPFALRRTMCCEGAA